MKICKLCGKENADEMNFCIECGAPLASSSKLQPEPTISVSESIPKTIRHEPVVVQKPRSKVFYILAGILVLGLLFVSVGVLIAYLVIKSALETASVSNQTSDSVENTQTANTDGRSKTPTEKSQEPTVSKTPPLSVESSSSNPIPSFTPPLSPTKIGKFTVYANGGWQLSDIDVVGNEEYITIVEGLIDLAGIKTSVTHAGIKDERTKSRRIYPEYPTGVLLMRTRYADGRFSNIQPILTSPAGWKNFPDETGKLEFCINDNAPENNGGHFVVTVRMIKAGDTNLRKKQNTTKRPRKNQEELDWQDSAGDILLY